MKQVTAFFILICVSSALSCAQNFDKRVDPNLNAIPIENSSVDIADACVIKENIKWNTLYDHPLHPYMDGAITIDIRDSIMNQINKRLSSASDSLRTSDIFYIWKPYFEWLNHQDPHYVVIPIIPYNIDYSSANRNSELKKAIKKFNRNAKILPVSLLQINDTLIVEHSLCEELEKGDILININGITTKQLLDYNYKNRHYDAYIMLTYYFYNGFANEYNVAVKRGDDLIVVQVPGYRGINDYEFRKRQQRETEHNIREYPEYNTGYIAIPEFYPNNSRLFKILRKTILSFKNKGYNTVILDLRNNPGGYGHGFNMLLSLFIDAPSVPYMRSQRHKVEDKIVEINSGESIINSIPLNNEYYIDGIKYYVLMDEGTGSVAASFCNILQYNEAAILVGEPLKHNALKFGETQPGRRFYSLTSSTSLFNVWLQEGAVSTIEYDEYTKNPNGYLLPDIALKYSVADYAYGDDGMLNQLLDILCVNYE